MKRSLYNAWLKELETAPKTKHTLKNQQGMCCLGVLCSIIPEVEEVSIGVYNDTYFKYKGDTKASCLPLTLANELDIHEIGISKIPQYRASLSYINDNNDTFEPIIKILKETPELYFTIEED